MSRTLLVSNRLPITLSATESGLQGQPSSGGLATALSSVHSAGESLWFGWPGAVGDAPEAEVDKVLAPLRAIPVHISPAEMKGYYDGFSNGVLWPLCHYLLDKVQLDAHQDWQMYRTVNERFADMVASHWREGDVVWVHDYQLALVPALLRQRCPQARIGFFLHIPFPGVEVFRILPWRMELLRGVMGADLVGFHTASYAYHFAYACSQLLGLEVSGDVLSDNGRPVKAAAFPIGIDAETFATRAASPAVQQRAETLRAEAQGRTILLSVDRFDYTKGLVRRALAIERLLTRYPEFKDKIHVIQLAVPTRENVDAYADYRRTVNELVGRINSAFGSPTRNIVHFLHRSVEPDELSALYVAADVMLVTPLRDGMNLVAKEYVASRGNDTGVLVLSELAGAATELHEALQINPYDLDAFVEAIVRAIEMSPDEQQLRMSELRRTVHSGKVSAWADSFVKALDECPAAPIAAPSAALDQVMISVVASPRLLLLLDYDGTLVEHSSSPFASTPDAELVTLLRRLTMRSGTSVHVISGRSRESLDDFLGELEVGLHAEHGLWSRRKRSAAWSSRTPVPPPWLEPIKTLIERSVRRTNGSFMEVKSGALAYHYRATEPQLGQRRVAELRTALARHPMADLFETLEGSRVLEVRQRGINKGVLVPEVLEEASGATVVAMGNDRTDEPMFAALPPSAVTIHVGTGESVARYRVAGVDEVRALLLELLERKK